MNRNDGQMMVKWWSNDGHNNNKSMHNRKEGEKEAGSVI